MTRESKFLSHLTQHKASSAGPLVLLDNWRTVVKTAAYQHPKSQFTQVVQTQINYKQCHTFVVLQRRKRKQSPPSKVTAQPPKKQMKGKSSPSSVTPLQMLSPAELVNNKGELQIVATPPFRVPDDWFVELKLRGDSTTSPGRVDKVISLSLSVFFFNHIFYLIQGFIIQLCMCLLKLLAVMYLIRVNACMHGMITCI